MSKKHKKVRRASNYFQQFFLFISAVSGCVLTSGFALLASVPVVAASTTIGLKFFALNAGIKKCKSIIKKKKETGTILKF